MYDITLLFLLNFTHQLDFSTNYLPLIQLGYQFFNDSLSFSAQVWSLEGTPPFFLFHYDTPSLSAPELPSDDQPMHLSVWSVHLLSLPLHLSLACLSLPVFVIVFVHSLSLIALTCTPCIPPYSTFSRLA